MCVCVCVCVSVCVCVCLCVCSTQALVMLIPCSSNDVMIIGSGWEEFTVALVPKCKHLE